MSEQAPHNRTLELALHGPFRCQWSDGTPVPVKGAKERALLAMLALSSHPMHSRSWVQEHLWSRSGDEHGRASLRRALSDLRKKLGPDFDRVFDVSNMDLGLRAEAIAIVTTPADGEVLEGVRINEPKFDIWLQQHRDPAPQYTPGSQPGRFAPPGSGSGAALIAPHPHAARRQVVPTLAVLPFQSVTLSPLETHFGDLLAQEIARSISRSQLIEVISHLSSRQFAGPQVDSQDISAHLNAQYLVHGTVFVDDTQFRLDADFIDLSTGRMLWTRQFGGQIADVLHAQSDMVANIAQACGQEIFRTSIELGLTTPLPQVDSHALFMSAVAGIHQQYWPTFAKAREHLEELCARLPDHSVLHAWLAKWYIIAIAQGWSSDHTSDFEAAYARSSTALEVNPGCPTSLTIDGFVRGTRIGEMDTSRARFQQALGLDPNNALGWLMYSRMQSYLGNGAQAVEMAQKARRLSPVDPYAYFFDIMEAMAQLVDGDADEALRLAKASIQTNPRHSSSFRVLAMAQARLGQTQEARQTVTRLLNLDPGLTVSGYLAGHPAGDQPIVRETADLLAQAGVPR